MKRLTKLLLIHWHYFEQQLLELEQINFLTGQNASGKSTIMDALQLVLLADTSGSFFNKAASGRGTRTLKGYLLGELGDDEASGFKHIREGRFTSYIALEFHDDIKNRYFTAGCCFDIFAENDIQKMFFLFDDKIPPDQFVIEQIPRDITSLKGFFNQKFSKSHYYLTNVNRDFRNNFYGKLGGLQERFGRLLKKAVSFDPQIEIEQFIAEFVCDNQQTVDISNMQENIRSYKRLEEDAVVLQARIDLLEQIQSIYLTYKNHVQNEMLYDYLIQRARVDLKSQELVRERAASQDLAATLDELSNTINNDAKHYQQLQNDHKAAQVQLLSNEQSQMLHHLETQIAEKNQQIQTLRTDYQKEYSLFVKAYSSWEMIGGKLIKKLLLETDLTTQNSFLTPLVQAFLIECQRFCTSFSCLDQYDANDLAKNGRKKLNELAAAANELKKHAIELATRFADEQQRIVYIRQEKQTELKTLESGIYQFPVHVRDLKDAITAQLRVKKAVDAEVLIVAEVAEIKNQRWRNAIEGYLYNQKFYLIVMPEYFNLAIQVYDQIKRQHEIYGTGIVDIGKLSRINPVADPGSLAEEIETDQPHVRLFLNFALGRVQKCDSVQELRRHRTAVTDEGMLYQSFVVSAMNPKRWLKPAIGQAAIRQRLEDVRQELEQLKAQFVVCITMKTTLELGNELLHLSESEIESIVLAAQNSLLISGLEQELALLKKDLEAVDRSALEAMQQRIVTLEASMKKTESTLEQNKEQWATLKERLRELKESKIPGLEQDFMAMQEDLAQKFASDWIEAGGELRYQRELSNRHEAANVEQAFPREQSRSKNSKEAAWTSLLNLRQQYNLKYLMGYDVSAPENDVYEQTWHELREIKLPDYQARIADARNKAFEQFQEDFLSRLQSNIFDARRQIDGLNKAIGGSYFGEETYHFRIVPKPDYKRYYDMITDQMLLQGGYNLLSAQFNAKYQEEITELFAIITNEGQGASSQSYEDYERRVHTFTDYRTYLSFDLEVINREGETQRLSKTIGKKSGGETQTPFYIAVLASFAQLYRIGRDKVANTARIILFDEAFSKMDGERIVRSIELLRSFNFQVVLCAPPDKVADIAPYVDKTIGVYRIGRKVIVSDFAKDEGIDYELL